MSLVSIHTAIKNKLDDVGGLHIAFGYETGKETGYPYATITHDRLESAFGDTKRNINDWFFTIRLYVERTPEGFGVDVAERISRELIDEVLTAFHMDVTLSGTCKFIEPLDADFSYTEGPESVRIAEITLKAQEVFDTALGTTT